MIKHLQPIELKINLDKLTLHKKSDRWGLSEPYLWNIFFRVDGDAIEINPNFTISGNGIFHLSKGSHRNLRVSIHNSKEVNIPKEVGVWETVLKPVKVPYFEHLVPGMTGVISVLMEENNVSNDGAEAGRMAFGEQVQQAMGGALKAFNPNMIDISDIQHSLSNYFQAQVGEFVDGIEKYVIDAIKKRQNILQNVWSLINADNLVGFHVWNFSQQDLMDNKGNIKLNHHWKSERYGHWEIEGEVNII
jgi:hypothetical protein